MCVVDDSLKLYQYDKSTKTGEWVLVANFKLEVRYHSINQLAGRSVCFVLKGTISDEPDPSKKTFLVPVSKGDCDTFPKLYKILDKSKKIYGATIECDTAGNKSRFTRYVRGLIEKYEKLPAAQKSGAIVANKIGYIQANIDGSKKTMFVLGPHCALPCSPGFGLADVEKLDLVWVGDPEAPDMRVRKPDSDREEAWVKALVGYCGVNVGSLCLLLGHVHLNMNIPDLALHGIKLPTAHCVGPMSSGKSELASNIQAMYPRRHVDGNFITESDRKMTVTLLSQETAKMRPPNIQGQ